MLMLIGLIIELLCIGVAGKIFKNKFIAVLVGMIVGFYLYKELVWSYYGL